MNESAPQNPKSRPTLLLVLAIFSFILGGTALLCNCFSVIPLFTAGINEQQWRVQQDRYDAQRQEREDDFEQRIDETETDEERQEIEDERERWHKKNPYIDLTAQEDPSRDPRFIAYTGADVGIGIITNILLIIAGVGLLKVAGWGRKLALGVAGVKLLANVLLTIVAVTVIVPMQTESMDMMMKQLEQMSSAGSKGAPPFPVSSFGDITKVAASGITILFGAFSCVFPALLLILLNLRGTRKAFLMHASRSDP